MKKLISFLLCLLVIFGFSVSASAEDDVYSAAVLIDDQANLLTQTERNALSSVDVSADFPFTVVISTVDSIGSQTPAAFANDRYDELCGSENGILLLVAMQSRDWYILTVGQVHERIDDSYCDAIAERFLPDLSDGRYYQAFDTFLEYLTADLDDDFTVAIMLIAAVAGLVVGLITILIMRSGMKTARPQRTATGYVNDGSFHLHNSFDFYLYSKVTRTPRPKSNSAGGGGGGSRGGSGGKF